MKGKTALVTGSSEGLGRANPLSASRRWREFAFNYHRQDTAA